MQKKCIFWILLATWSYYSFYSRCFCKAQCSKQQLLTVIHDHDKVGSKVCTLLPKVIDIKYYKHWKREKQKKYGRYPKPLENAVMWFFFYIFSLIPEVFFLKLMNKKNESWLRHDLSLFYSIPVNIWRTLYLQLWHCHRHRPITPPPTFYHPKC